MTSLMANFDPDSEEYKILKYRTQCGQAQQQAEIDKAKGIVSNPMPKSWYVWSENVINDDDSEEIKQKKKLYQRICAHKKPYFFQYNYDYLRSSYLQAKQMADENCVSLFNKSLDELLYNDELTDNEKRFITKYKNRLELDFSASTMNRICYAIEKVFNAQTNIVCDQFDYKIYKSNVGYTHQEYSMVKKLLTIYREDQQAAIKDKKLNSKLENINDDKNELDSDQLLMLLNQKVDEVIPCADIQCDILLDLCYEENFNKQIVWTICGDTIVNNLLKKYNNIFNYPKKQKNGEFVCCGNEFLMETFAYKGGEYEEF